MPAFEKAKKRGVSIKIAAPVNTDNEKVAKDFSKVAEVKNSTDMGINGRFVIVDSEQLMFMVLDDKTVHPNYDVGIWLSTTFLAQSLEQLFEVAWKDMKPISGSSLSKVKKKK